jgi:hypothetical protein
MKNNNEYLDKMIKILEPPYFKEMEYYGIDGKEEMEYILSRVCGFDIRINLIGRCIYDSRGEIIYIENSKGGYIKWIKSI